MFLFHHHIMKYINPFKNNILDHILYNFNFSLELNPKSNMLDIWSMTVHKFYNIKNKLRKYFDLENSLSYIISIKFYSYYINNLNNFINICNKLIFILCDLCISIPSLFYNSCNHPYLLNFHHHIPHKVTKSHQSN